MKKTNVIRLLSQKKIPHQTVDYHYDSEDLSVEKIAAENGLVLDQIYKTLVLQGDKTGILVALVGGNAHLSLKKLAQLSGNKKVAMLPVKALQANTGYIRGGCSPLGMKKLYPTYLDQVAESLDEIYVNAGIRGQLVGIAPSDLVVLAKAIWGNLTD